MLFIFPLVYIISFAAAFKEVLNGNKQGVLTFIIFGLSIYTTAMSVAFMIGLKGFIPFSQFFKEVLILMVLFLSLATLKQRPKLHLIDYAILAFFLYTFLYALLPIGEQNLFNRLIAFKSTSFFAAVYFAARFIDIRDVYINKYFNYILLLTIAAGLVLLSELILNQQLQTKTGLVDYIYYFFNVEPSGDNGLTTTFDAEGGYKRFASFFSNPLEHACSTLIALSIMLALFTNSDKKFKPSSIGVLGFIASLLSIIFAFSRAPFISYFVIIYLYALVTHKKYIIKAVNILLMIAAVYIFFLFTRFGDNKDIAEVIVNTIDFSNPSSAGHILQWVEGIVSMAQNPLGLGLGTSGRVAATYSENVGGENQYIIIGVQAGIVALLLYLSVYIMLIKVSFKWVRHLKGKEYKLCLAVFLIKIGLFIPLMTSEVESSSYVSYINWFLSGLLINLIMQKPALQVQSIAND